MLFSMHKKNQILSYTLLFFLIVPNIVAAEQPGFFGVHDLNYGDLVITEVMYNPAVVSDRNGEWFEVYNNTSYYIDIYGLQIYDNNSGSNVSGINDHIYIAPNSYFIFSRNSDYTRNGGVPTGFKYNTSFYLSNTSDNIIVAGTNGIIDEVSWSRTNYPNIPGVSMSLHPNSFDPDENDYSGYWQSAQSQYGNGDFGTPAMPNDSWSSLFHATTPLAADVSRLGGSRITSGDLNGDGYIDIITINHYGTISIFLNNGDGFFAEQQILSEEHWDIHEDDGATDAAIVDLDGDGYMDIVVTLYGDCYRQSMIQLYNGDGSGNFTLWNTDHFNANSWEQSQNGDGIVDGIVLTRGINPMTVDIADFNQDGLMDFVIGSNNGSHSIDVLLQKDDGEFTVHSSERVGANPTNQALGTALKQP